MNVLAIAGSLRKASFNRLLLQAAAEVAPPGMQIEIFDGLGDVPPFDSDRLQAGGFPAAVERLRDALRRADGVIFASPEYNFSVSGVLKNAIDWVSRPPDQPLDGKPYAIMTASQGAFGGARSQYDLRKILLFLNAHGLNRPEVFVGMAQTRFDAAGRLVDEATRKVVREQLAAFHAHVSWVQRGYAAVGSG